MKNLGKETETREFKLSTASIHQAIESAVAMLNKHGRGEIYFGVADDGEIKGQPISDSTIRDIAEAFSRDIEPRLTPTVEPLEEEGRQYVRVSVSGTSLPYSAFGRFLIRVGSSNRNLSSSELRRIIQRQDYSYPWEREPSGATLEDLDDDALRKYYDEAISCGRLSLERYDKESLLSALGLYRDGVLCNAGYALFGKDARISLKLSLFATDEKLTFLDLDLRKGNIYNLIDIGVSYILSKINWRAVIERKRIEIPEIPVKAIREIVVNAFAHALYEPTPEIEINVHPGMITIFNPGAFPEDLSPSDYVERSIASLQRNPLILEVLYRRKDVEKSGTGFKRVDQMCRKEGIKWSAESTRYGFYFTFHRPDPSLLSAKALLPELSDCEARVWSLLRNNPRMTREELAEATGKSVRTVQRLIDSLVEKGLLIRLGNARGGYWETVEK